MMARVATLVVPRTWEESGFGMGSAAQCSSGSEVAWNLKEHFRRKSRQFAHCLLLLLKCL